ISPYVLQRKLRQPDLALAQPAKNSRCGANLIAERGEFFASHFKLLALSLSPLLRGCLEATVSTGDARRGGLGESGAGEMRLQPALNFRQFRKDNSLCRNAAQLSDEPDFRQCPNNPFCRVELPGLHAVAVVILKFMMIVMVTLAHG